MAGWSGHIWVRILAIQLLVLTTAYCEVPEDVQVCEDLNGYFTREKESAFHGQHRNVDPDSGNNSEECLNSVNLPNPPPCKTLQFALHGHENISVPIFDLVVHIAPGTLQLTGRMSVINSHRIAIVGSGADATVFNCGEDKLCAFMNFQIRNSSYISISGVTFTRCGPITSSLYIAESEHIFVEDCVFRDMISPPLLVYNTPTVLFKRTHFTNNRPQFLPRNISSDICYFSGGQDVFFLDNRTTSGAVSLYMEGEALTLLISDCLFQNLSARPDVDISLPRFSRHYGHGGAMNLRVLNGNHSKICIEGSPFIGNFAEAHAGAIAMAFADSATMNRVQVQNCTFENNSCTDDKCSGGAFGVDFFAETAFNQVEVSDSVFSDNAAEHGSGGAMSISATDIAVSQGDSNSVTLRNCSFERNTAFYEGTALGVFSLTHTSQPGLPLRLIDCLFVSNNGSRGSEDTTAVTIYRVLLILERRNSFINNSGGGLSLLQARMDVMGRVEFEGNTAVFGAGIAMSGRSLLVLYSGAHLKFMNNTASQQGGGMYVEYTSSDFVLRVLNRGCFLQYYSTFVDIAPDQWNATVEFKGNKAQFAGAAMYANDMSRCKWLGKNLTEDYFIFQTQLPDSYKSPFRMIDNKVVSEGIINNELATDASSFSADVENITNVSFGERVSFNLSSLDQLMNFRQSVWTLDVNGTLDPQPLGALSTNGTVYVYKVPQKEDLEGKLNVKLSNSTADLVANFMLVGNQDQQSMVALTVDRCHPGYKFNDTTQECECQDGLREIVRCDSFNRYFYAKDGLWVGLGEDNTPFFSTTIPGFLNCTRAGTLPGCLFKFDDRNDQCASGRIGTLCGDCEEGYGVTFDLRFCKKDCGAGGIALFIIICIATLLLALLILYFDFPIPDEMKGVIFFAQVIGVIYRNTPYLLDQPGPGYKFFDFLINALGYALPFPVCLWEGLSATGVAFLGFVSPIIATVTAILYVVSAQQFPFLSKRTYYKFNGFYFLWLFVYKYLVDVSFIFVSCTRLDNEMVFIYEGSQKCLEFPFVIVLVLAIVFLLILGVALPVYVLYIIYQPQKAIQVSNALTAGLKDKRRYRWYGVWDIWRRLPFVAANLFISLTGRSTVLFIHCLLIFICLAVVCIVKPYKRTYINVLEVCALLCLMGATISLLDENDGYVGMTTSIVFISIPFTFGFLFVTYKLVRYTWHKADKRWHQNDRIHKSLGKGLIHIPYYEGLWRLWRRVRDFQWMDVDSEPTVELQEEWIAGERSTGDEETTSEGDSGLREPLLDDDI